MSKAKTLSAAVAARLQTILTANGYTTDLGANVYRGQTAIPDDHLPAAVLVELEDEIETQAVTHKTSTGAEVISNILLPLNIEIIAEAADPHHPADTAHDYIADVKRAIFSGDLTWGKLATHTRYLGRNINPPEPGSNLITARVQIRIGYIEDLANP